MNTLHHNNTTNDIEEEDITLEHPEPQVEDSDQEIEEDKLVKIEKKHPWRRLLDTYQTFLNGFSDQETQNEMENLDTASIQDQLDKRDHYVIFGQLNFFTYNFGKYKLEHTFDNPILVLFNLNRSRLEIPIDFNEKGIKG